MVGEIYDRLREGLCSIGEIYDQSRGVMLDWRDMIGRAEFMLVRIYDRLWELCSVGRYMIGFGAYVDWRDMIGCVVYARLARYDRLCRYDWFGYMICGSLCSVAIYDRLRGDARWRDI